MHVRGVNARGKSLCLNHCHHCIHAKSACRTVLFLVRSTACFSSSHLHYKVLTLITYKPSKICGLWGWLSAFGKCVFCVMCTCSVASMCVVWCWLFDTADEFAKIVEGWGLLLLSLPNGTDVIWLLTLRSHSEMLTQWNGLLWTPTLINMSNYEYAIVGIKSEWKEVFWKMAGSLWHWLACNCLHLMINEGSAFSIWMNQLVCII